MSAAANSLTRTAATTGAGSKDFNAGAVSAPNQWITRGDGYVEFSASETNRSHVSGLSEIAPDCASPCTDADASLSDIAFSISLNHDGRYYVLEHGAVIAGPDANGSWGTYTEGQRFRVTAKQSSAGTARIVYSRVTGTCSSGTLCPDLPFYEHVGDAARYPLRVDASFREQGATLNDVRIVRAQ